MGALKKRCWHCSRCGTSELSCYFSNTDSPYIRCYEEVRHESKFVDVVAHVCSSTEDEPCFVLDEVLAKFCLYDAFSAIANWAYSVHDRASSFLWTAAAVGCFLLGAMSKQLCYCLSNFAIFTLVPL